MPKAKYDFKDVYPIVSALINTFTNSKLSEFNPEGGGGQYFSNNSAIQNL